MRRAATLAQQAAGRELAVLVDGPWAVRWFLRTTGPPRTRARNTPAASV